MSRRKKTALVKYTVRFNYSIQVMASKNLPVSLGLTALSFILLILIFSKLVFILIQPLCFTDASLWKPSDINAFVLVVVLFFGGMAAVAFKKT